MAEDHRRKDVRIIERLPLYCADRASAATGRLHFHPDCRAAGISRLGTGAELFVVDCALRLDNLATSGRGARRGVCRDLIFVVQCTRFACGGVALGIRLHHIVCDASGFFQLVRHLAEIYRKLASAQGPAEPGDPGPKIEAFNAGPISQVAGRVTGRVLRFTGPQLQQLKALATDPRGASWVSTFEALSVYLYQQVYRARVQLLQSRGGAPVSEVPACLSRGFWGSIDLPGPTRLTLPKHYFPNAVTPLILSDPSHALLVDGSLWQVAAALHAVVRSFNLHQMENELKWIAMQPDKSRIKVRFRFGGGNFTVSLWSKHSMYCGIDFDADEGNNALSPVLVSPPLHRAAQPEGSPELLPPSLDVNLILMEHLWPILPADEQFRQYCC
ncbi:hypothetical protein BP00DRAFT_434207 [Aspergillus indologenus CBS 114.80]|uniref:Transferase family protein n=1 Tax=Aspergillus indologenus CBS 114.80 TaxID=1450541 RepID=A0A2V5IID9_9EURO|nr:hypothetical protein BP00DRAFT_434207 [Aspergillus indologenus CBS 114.80]